MTFLFILFYFILFCLFYTIIQVTQNVHAQEVNTAKGVLGRINDALTARGVNCGSYSLSGNPKVLEPKTSDGYAVVPTDGVVIFDGNYRSTRDVLLNDIFALTENVSESM